MELREWLIILGLALVSLIVIDGVRRLQRQRRVPRLDQARGSADAQGKTDARDPEAAARHAELDWELPNGGARVVSPADYSNLAEKPPLERQEPEHPGPSRVFAESRRSRFTAPRREPRASAEPEMAMPETATQPTATPQQEPTLGAVPPQPAAPQAPADTAEAQPAPEPEREREQEKEQAPEEEAPAASGFALRAEAEDARAHQVSYRPASRRQLRSDTVGEYDDEDEEEYRLVDIEGMGRSVKKRLVQRRRARQEAKKRRQEDKARRADVQAREQAERQARRQQEQEEKQRRQEAQLAAKAEQDRLAAEQEQAREAAEQEQAREAAERQRQAEEARRAPTQEAPEEAPEAAYPPEDDFRPASQPAMEPILEKALRNDVPGGYARKTLTDADELIVISVMSRDAEGFDGLRLLELLMACGLRYSQGLGVFHRFETESEDSELQFSMVNVVKPGSFPVEEGAPFTCPGITFLMPLPGAEESAAAFEAMVETAMVVVRHMGGELKDENHSVMTAQTIEFARQQVHEFERRHRLHRQLQAQ
ncbi:cell division protein ZipA C-terminal FtsZ-binding domain-containing protein [Halomonas garicola]|uniref:cell division protein ZipA C-terminal FtsZ-binding domain-containing protein n=1 Tax=Halomonas garicola TaxID=1690008 RepID=UPI00289DBC5F|nr:cell division protein ZipA C-terminal FtsZ-binding domain-containing protein [Halomonas garicola]